MSGQVRLYLKLGLLEELGVKVVGPPEGVPDLFEGRIHGYAAPMTGVLGVDLPGGSFAGFGAGALEGGRAPTLLGVKGGVALSGYSLRASSIPDSLDLVGADGRVWFRADHVHVHHDGVKGSFEVRNADLRVSPALASRLGDPHLVELAVGVLEFSGVAMPHPVSGGVAGLKAPGAAQCGTPDFDLPVDIALTQISSVQQSAIESGRMVITPSAELQNVGQADVRWEPALDPDHPMLVWALYRLSGDQFEQIGVSVAKHAFFATNIGCPCEGSTVLWAGGCGDVYGVFTNEDRSNLAPRAEVQASTVSWDSCGSVFDANCDGLYDITLPANELERRMSVPLEALQTPGARYFIEAWYLVSGDVDIFNSMGWREVRPFFTGTFWTFHLQTPFAAGSALDAWVPAGTLTATESAQRYAGPNGHFQLTSQVTDLGGGRHRYEYALMNFDFDRQIARLAIPLAAGATPTDLVFADGSETATDDWSPEIGAAELRWEAPAGQGLDWGRLARFAVTVDVASQPGFVGTQPLEAGDPSTLALPALVPLPEATPITGLLVGSAALVALRRQRRSEEQASQRAVSARRDGARRRATMRVGTPRRSSRIM